jgi:glutathione S-transferase
MRLYHAPASPFVRKVTIVLHETGLVDQVEIVPAVGTPLAPGSLPVVRNPLGKVPTLERDDGPALHDSRVICRYLDDRAGGGRIYPSKPRLWETLTLEAIGDGIAEAALLIVYEARLRAWVEAQWQKVSRAADALEDRWLGFLAGPFDAGQIAVASGLGYADFRLPERDWRSGRPGLAAWFDRVSARPALAATRPQ